MRRFVIALVALCTLVPAGSAFAADDTPDDRIVISGNVLVDRGETVPGSVVVLDGDVLIRGKVDGDVFVASGDATIRGTVDGDVVTGKGQAILGRKAVVTGDVAYFNHKPVITPGAKVSGDVKKAGGEASDVLQAIAFAFWIAMSLSLVVFGLLLMLLAPKAAEAVARTARARWGMSIGIGFAVFILLPIVGVLLAVTFFGTPLGAILLLSLVPLAAMAFVSTAFVVGRLILKNSGIPAFLLGMLILCLLALVPFLGALVGTLAVIFGLGLLFTTLIRARA